MRARLPDPARIPEAPAGASLEALRESTTPVVIRGLAAGWPAVAASRRGPLDAIVYLRELASDAAPATATIAPPEAGGRIFYDVSMRGFNFRHEQVPAGVALATLARELDNANAPMIYLGATTLDTWFPGFARDNRIDFGDRTPLASIWIGNRTRVPAHHDLPDNLACVVAGRRRFTLFPPEQIGNLYIGPLDVTPAGQPVSLVDPQAPDLERFPRFSEAWAHAQVAELGPGDAVLIPSLWWHAIDALDGFNVLVNYWWRRTPDWMDAPLNALMAGLLAIRQLPAHERAHWKHMFDHYVFDADHTTSAHIPETARGVLAPFDEAGAANLRRLLRQRLER
ncbi:cupin-like domain-containing protein [Luteimonas terrae]|uniref:Cupin-like domain-containing protein n=1 Tax=Luteimonas terrae TaxID=1530191 RepID=A0A4R5U8F0_9GAMM|nr:cupin-like domain-containing protein [Luteimonas terrae]